MTDRRPTPAAPEPAYVAAAAAAEAALKAKKSAERKRDAERAADEPVATPKAVRGPGTPLGVGVPARWAAISALVRVETDGAWLSKLWGGLFAPFPDAAAADRALAVEIASGVLRRCNALDRIVAAVSSRPPADLDARALAGLRAGLYQLIYLDRVPDHAAISTTVDATAALGGRPAAGYVNACLRTFQRRRAEFADPHAHPDPVEARRLRHGLPAWLDTALERFVAARTDAEGAEAAHERIAAWLAARPPLALRPNRTRTTADELTAQIAAAGINVRRGKYAPDAVVLDGGDPTTLPGFAEGHFTVQDEAAQLVGLLADIQPGMRVLDIGAAPGGKTGDAAERTGPTGRVIGIEKNGDRARAARENLARLGLTNVEVLTADGERPGVAKSAYDRVIVDAPCSGLGVLRRHPEGRRLKNPSDFGLLAEIQGRLLDAAALYVKPGGRLVYAVCTFTADEGEKRIRRFLAEHANFTLDAPGEAEGPFTALVRDGRLETTGVEGLDGFFAARLRRVS